MIKGILFALFFILLAVAIAGIVLFAIKSHKVQADWDNISTPDRWSSKAPEIPAEVEKEYDGKMCRAKAGMFASIAAGVALLGLVICVPGSFHQVETGTVAVVKQLGVIKEVRTPGTYFDFYMVNSYETYDTKVQQDKIITAAYSKDGQTMDLEVFLQYQVQVEHIKEIATQYGNLDALQSRIETQTIEKTKAVMSSDIAMNIIQNRAQFSNDVSDAVRLALAENTPRKVKNFDDTYSWHIADNGRLVDTEIPWDEHDICEVRDGYWYINNTNTAVRYNSYFVDVRDVVLTNIDFTDEFEKAVEDKVIAEQEKQAAITRAEAELEVAKLEAQKKIEQARGDAEAQKIIAKAAAEAATYNIIELARTVGYTVNETYIYSVNGLETEFDTKQIEVLEGENTVIYLGTKYVIDTTTGPGPDKFKSLVEDYLAYLEYLKVWNGELPDVVAGDDAISIIVPNGN